MDIALMYHYVRNPKNFKGSVPVSKEEFRTQLEALNKKFKIVSPDDFKKESKDNRCIITFDDGTKDQYENAYKVLKEMGLPGYFTVMSGPLIEKKIPIFHLVHTLLSEFDDDEIWKELNGNYEIPDVSNAHEIYRYEKNHSRRYIKYVLNFIWNEEQSKDYLKYKIGYHYKNVDNFINNFYITKNQFKEMSRNGMTIGAHAHKHIGFEGGGEEFFVNEIAPCLKYIENELEIQPKWYTPAFGGGENKLNMREELKPLLVKNRIEGVFTTDEGVNNGLKDYWINRYDCNKFNQVLNLI